MGAPDDRASVFAASRRLFGVGKPHPVGQASDVTEQSYNASGDQPLVIDVRHSHGVADHRATRFKSKLGGAAERPTSNDGRGEPSDGSGSAKPPGLVPELLCDPDARRRLLTVDLVERVDVRDDARAWLSPFVGCSAGHLRAYRRAIPALSQLFSCWHFCTHGGETEHL